MSETSKIFKLFCRSHRTASNCRGHFAAAGVDATTASFDAALQLASDDDVKFRDEYRYTVLHKMQEFHDWPRQIGAAIDRGCDIDAANEYGDTALHFAALHNATRWAPSRSKI